MARTKVLMVCLGNICRSPLAEGILRSKIDEDAVFVDSAGTGSFHIGNPPDPRSVAIAKENGIAINQQRCRVFKTSDFDDFDLIYAMDHSNRQHLIAMAKNDAQRAKISLLLSDDREVPDPYYGGADGFQKVFEMIDEACEGLATTLKKTP